MGIAGIAGIDASRLAPRADPGATGDCGHLVQFYDADAVLVDAASRFIGVGFDAGEGGILIATRLHLDGIEGRLRASGLDIATARRQGRYVALDAAETLSRFMDGGRPEAGRFADVLGGVIAAAAGGGRLPVRVFGEMVALLWAEGNREAAVRLEKLWNELAGSRTFSLLCAYPMRSFGRARDGSPFLEICAEHSRVLPAESYAEVPTAEDRLRSVAWLQQKAIALEAEIAETRELEKRLRRREQELSDFLENAMEGLHRVGPDGTILWANAAEMDLLGYAPDEYVGHHIAEFHVDREVVDGIFEKLLRGETLSEQPARLRCKDGSIKHVLIHANAFWEDGAFLHARCFTRDVTERVRAERELAGLLAREQTARAEAERLARSKDEFLATLSHELRTPLTSMVGWIRMLRSGQLDAVKSAYALEVLDRNTQAQARLIEDLLDVSRIVRGQLHLDVRQVELAAVIRGVMEAIRPAAEGKAIRLERALDPSAGSIAGDPDRLQQVVWNLLMNAVKYTPHGGRIDVGLRRVGSTAQITVTDTGIGIGADFLPRLFERFSQAAGGPSRGRSGLGLGLAIVRHLVELHGGTVQADSPGENCGATFTVSLPLSGIDSSPRSSSSAAPKPARSARLARLWTRSPA